MRPTFQEDRQSTYHVTLRTSQNHLCRGKTISKTHSKYVFIALYIQLFICDLFRYTIFFHIIFIKCRIFVKKKLVKINVCFDFLYNFCCNISHSAKNSANYDQKCYWSSCKLSVILKVSQYNSWRNQLIWEWKLAKHCDLASVRLYRGLYTLSLHDALPI